MATTASSATATAVLPRVSRREDILAHALGLFAEHGVHTVSTRQIAAAVGISQPSLYAHFATKQALVDEVCARAFDTLAMRMREVAGDLTGLGRLAVLARVYVDFGLSEPDAYRIAFMIEGGTDEPPGKPGPGLGAGLRVFAIHRNAVAEELGQNLSEADIDLLAQSLWASLHGLVSLMVARPSFPWADRERLIALHIARNFAA